MSGRRLRDAQQWRWGCRAAVALAPLTAVAALLWSLALHRDERFEAMVPDALVAYAGGAVLGAVAGLVAGAVAAGLHGALERRHPKALVVPAPRGGWVEHRVEHRVPTRR